MEVHLQLCEFLTSLELKYMSQTCVALQRIYRPESWRNCIVFKVRAQLYHEIYSTCFDPFCRYRRVSLEAVSRPERFSWFDKASVHQISSNSYFFGQEEGRADEWTMNRINVAEAGVTAGAMSTTAEVLNCLDVTKFPQLQKVNVIKGLQLSVGKYTSIMNSNFIQELKRINRGDLLWMDVSSFHGTDETVLQAIEDLEQLHVSEIRDIRISLLAAPIRPPPRLFSLPYIKMISIASAPAHWLEYFLKSVREWPCLEILILEPTMAMALKEQGQMVISKRYILALQNLPRLKKCRITLAFMGNLEIGFSVDMAIVASRLDQRFGEVPHRLDLPAVTEIKVQGSLGMRDLLGFLHLPNLEFLEFRGSQKYHGSSLNFEDLNTQALNKLSLSLCLDVPYFIAIKSLAKLPNLEYLRVCKETFYTLGYTYGSEFQTQLLDLYHDTGRTLQTADDLIISDGEPDLSDWVYTSWYNKVCRCDECIGPLGDRGKFCKRRRTIANILLGIVWRPLETLELIHESPLQYFTRNQREIYSELCSIEAIYEQIRLGKLGKLKYLSVCTINAFEVSPNLQQLLDMFVDGGDGCDDFGKNNLREEANPSCFSDCSNFRVQAHCETPASEQQLQKKQLPRLPLQQVKLKLYGFVGPIATDPRFEWAPRFPYSLYFEGTQGRERASVLYDVKQQRRLDRQFERFKQEVYIGEVDGIYENDNESQLNHKNSKWVHKVKTPLPKVIYVDWQLPDHDLFAPDFDGWLR